MRRVEARARTAAALAEDTEKFALKEPDRFKEKLYAKLIRDRTRQARSLNMLVQRDP